MDGVCSDDKHEKENNLERTSSYLSTASRKSGTIRSRSRKRSLVTPTSAKTLESFPSLSPDASPGPKQHTQLISSPPSKSFSETPRKASKKVLSTVDSLVNHSPSFQGRSALFADSPKSNVKDVPGALHLASDEHVQRLVKKSGVVSMVRQLAEDLAERDAEITDFRRRAERRERELKKMLREVEVSNLDIETRLHRIENDENTVGQQGPTFKTIGKERGPGDKKDMVSGVNNAIDEMMGEAMIDGLGISELDEGYLDSLDKDDKQPTVQAGTIFSKDSDGRSIASSMDSRGRPRSTLRGWKDYLWSGTTTSRKNSRASSLISDSNEDVQTVVRTGGGYGRRKGLDDELFQPVAQASSMQSTGTDRKSSASVSSWATKLFAGNPKAGRESENQSTIRGRSATTGASGTKNPRTISTTSGPVPQSAKAALMKVSSMNHSDMTFRKPVQPLSLGPNGTVRGSHKPSNPQLPTSPVSVDAATNLGPVEMDTIHPPDSKPPTLMQSSAKSGSSNNLLTDRFGFIYDQRRRKRETEATVSHRRGISSASANVEMISGARESFKLSDNDQVSHPSNADSLHRPDTPLSTDDKTADKPAKRWQDYLKVATFPTELLSHTPSPKPGASAIRPKTLSPQTKHSSASADARGSLPSISHNPEPEMSPVTAGNAELSKSSLSPSAAESNPAALEPEPVKLLLSQLTDLHDTLQREKTVKWNEFLRKVRAERKKEGETAASSSDLRSSKQAVMPEVTLTDGEMIGVAGLGNKGKVGQAKWKEFKGLVLAGIPVAYRAKIWAECSGASALRVPGYYDDLVANGTEDPSIHSQIQMDIHRTLTDNVFFRHGPGVAKLNEVLLAYSRRNPEVGYCQGMNMIAASLLLVMPTAEDVFWALTSMIESILPRNYYDHSLLASRADQQVLRQYVSEILPKLSAHLDDLGIELEALTFQWFLSIFTDCLSAEALFRVWDVVLCFNDGSTFLFQVALALLKLNEQQLLGCNSPAKVYGYIGNEMTDHAISIDGLIGASEGLKKVVKRAEVEERRSRAVEVERENGRARGSIGGSSGRSTSGDLVLREPRPVED